MKHPSRKLWIVKVGTKTFLEGGARALADWATQIAALRSQFGTDVVWVTSGSLALGMSELGIDAKQPGFDWRRAMCAIGQPRLMTQYQTFLDEAGLRSAQLLIVRHDLEIQSQREDFVRTIELLLEWGVVPIVNENDVAAIEGNQFKDNDWLAAIVAEALDADRLVYGTDVEGLLDEDGNVVQFVDPAADTGPAVEINRSPGAIGAGGMASKLSAAKEAASKGVEVWLIKGDDASVLIRLASGDHVGTCVSRLR